MTTEMKTRQLIVRIEHDDSPECPMDWCCQWRLHSFNRRSIHNTDPSEFFNDKGNPSIGLRRKLSVGLAFMLDYYEHGQGAYSLAGEGMQCQWDTSDNAGILIWEHSPKEMGAKTLEERAKDARNFLETYNNWMNGYVYGYIIETVDGEHVDSCWGYYSDADVTDAITAQLENGDRIKIEGQCEWAFEKCRLPKDKSIEIVDNFNDEENDE